MWERGSRRATKEVNRGAARGGGGGCRGIGWKSSWSTSDVKLMRMLVEGNRRIHLREVADYRGEVRDISLPSGNQKQNFSRRGGGV